MQYDFRSIYGSVLSDWLEVEDEVINDILFGEFQKIDLFSGCAPVATNNIPAETIALTIYPNPAEQKLSIQFESKGELIKISVFDTLGHEIKVLTNQIISRGPHTLQLDVREFPSGPYFIRMQTRHAARTVRVVKM